MLAGALMSGILVFLADKRDRHRRSPIVVRKRRYRDMWKNSLVECYHEPSKYRFGPGRIIPAERKTDRAK